MTSILSRNSFTGKIAVAAPYSQRRACALVGLHPRTYRYASTRPDDNVLRAKLRELASQRRRFGYTYSKWQGVAQFVHDPRITDEPAWTKHVGINFEVGIANLARLGVIEVVEEDELSKETGKADDDFRRMLRYWITPFGQKFVEVCVPTRNG